MSVNVETLEMNVTLLIAGRDVLDNNSVVRVFDMRRS